MELVLTELSHEFPICMSKSSFWCLDNLTLHIFSLIYQKILNNRNGTNVPICKHIADIGDMKESTYRRYRRYFCRVKTSYTRFIFYNMWVNISEISAIFLDGQNILHTVYLLCGSTYRRYRRYFWMVKTSSHGLFFVICGSTYRRYRRYFWMVKTSYIQFIFYLGRSTYQRYRRYVCVVKHSQILVVFF